MEESKCRDSEAVLPITASRGANPAFHGNLQSTTMAHLIARGRGDLDGGAVAQGREGRETARAAKSADLLGARDAGNPRCDDCRRRLEER